MRAPSTDLLRALRRAAAKATTSSPLQASRPQAPCQRSPSSMLRRCVAQRPHPSALLRSFSTHTSLYHPSSSSSRPPSATPTSRSPNISPKPPTARPPPPSRPSPRLNPRAPASHDRGPASKEETQTDFQKLDIYASAGVQEPATSIDACTFDGFHLNNGVQTSGGRGVLLLGGEGFVWMPWNLTNSTTMTEQKGQGEAFTQFLDTRGILHFPADTLTLLAMLYPKPDLLIVGTGRKLHMLSRETRRYLSEELGMKVDAMDTANAAAAYNLLVMERGVEGVGAILIPDGWAGR